MFHESRNVLMPTNAGLSLWPSWSPNQETSNTMSAANFVGFTTSLVCRCIILEGGHFEQLIFLTFNLLIWIFKNCSTVPVSDLTNLKHFVGLRSIGSQTCPARARVTAAFVWTAWVQSISPSKWRLSNAGSATRISDYPPNWLCGSIPLKFAIGE